MKILYYLLTAIKIIFIVCSLSILFSWTNEMAKSYYTFTTTTVEKCSWKSNPIVCLLKTREEKGSLSSVNEHEEQMLDFKVKVAYNFESGYYNSYIDNLEASRWLSCDEPFVDKCVNGEGQYKLAMSFLDNSNISNDENWSKTIYWMKESAKLGYHEAIAFLKNNKL